MKSFTTALGEIKLGIVKSPLRIFLYKVAVSGSSKGTNLNKEYF